MNGYYYLHTNGELIYKKYMPDQSDFVRAIWPVDVTNRATAWTLLLESLAMGANQDRIEELSLKWGCTAQDFVMFIRRHKPSELEKAGAESYFRDILHVDLSRFWDWLRSTPTGAEPDLSTMPAAGDNADA